ncbi:MAG: hypothetical protein WBP45_14895 [Daejeonella sp.]
MKYQKEQKVMLLDRSGKPLVNAIVMDYDEETKLYHVKYSYPTTNLKIENENVPENRLITNVDIVNALKKDNSN